MTPELKEQMEEMLLTDNSGVIMGYCFFLGFCVMLAINQIEMVLQLICPSVVGFLFMMSILILSFCTETPLMPGNYLMLCRTAIFEGGKTNLIFGCIYMLIIWLLFVFTGKIIMENKDL